jgi:hypothetical protein
MRSLAVAACVISFLATSCTHTDDLGDCPGPIELAAGGVPLALSCAEPDIIFRDQSFNPVCVSLHASRVGGRVQEVSAKGYHEVRRVKGFPPSIALLTQGRPRCGDQEQVLLGRLFDESDWHQIVLPHPSIKLDSPRLELPDDSLRARSKISIFIGAPDDFIYGMDAYIQRRVDGRWKDVVLVYTDPRQAVNPSVRLSERPGVRDIGYTGNHIVRVELPYIRKGRYRLRKDFVRHGSEPIEERVVTRTIEFRMLRP